MSLKKWSNRQDLRTPPPRLIQNKGLFNQTEHTEYTEWYKFINLDKIPTPVVQNERTILNT